MRDISFDIVDLSLQRLNFLSKVRNVDSGIVDMVYFISQMLIFITENFNDLRGLSVFVTNILYLFLHSLEFVPEIGSLRSFSFIISLKSDNRLLN